MTNWIFEYVGKKLNSHYHPEVVDQIIATDRSEAVKILLEMGVVWSSLYALKPAPPIEESVSGNEPNNNGRMFR